jgi:hypothetical protein
MTHIHVEYNTFNRINFILSNNVNTYAYFQANVRAHLTCMSNSRQWAPITRPDATIAHSIANNGKKNKKPQIAYYYGTILYYYNTINVTIHLLQLLFVFIRWACILSLHSHLYRHLFAIQVQWNKLIPNLNKCVPYSSWAGGGISAVFPNQKTFVTALT